LSKNRKKKSDDKGKKSESKKEQSLMQAKLTKLTIQLGNAGSFNEFSTS
jgi:hypothetical protein